jgi:hypothetical protein
MPGVLRSTDEPLSAHRLVAATLDLYRRFPLLFLVLAAGVVIPYSGIVLAVTGAGPFEEGSVSVGASLFLTLADLALITPLVSALHIHAVAAARAGETPKIPAVARQGLRVLPVVAAASIVSWLGIFLGLLALVIPGLLLMLRWSVVAQTAAIENQGWLPALRRSGHLTDHRYRHILLVFVYAGLIAGVPAYLIGLGFSGDTTTPASFLVGTVVGIVAASFGALVTALLYYDLRGRQELEFVAVEAEEPAAGQLDS